MFYISRSHIPSRHEREVSEFRKLEREKSFDEARTAVQSQIEKIFLKSQQQKVSSNNNNVNKSARILAATNNVRLSRRDQNEDRLQHPEGTRIHQPLKKRMPSLEPKVTS